MHGWFITFWVVYTIPFLISLDEQLLFKCVVWLIVSGDDNDNDDGSNSKRRPSTSPSSPVVVVVVVVVAVAKKLDYRLFAITDAIIWSRTENCILAFGTYCCRCRLRTNSLFIANNTTGRITWWSMTRCLHNVANKSHAINKRYRSLSSDRRSVVSSLSCICVSLSPTRIGSSFQVTTPQRSSIILPSFLPCVCENHSHHSLRHRFALVPTIRNIPWCVGEGPHHDEYPPIPTPYCKVVIIDRDNDLSNLMCNIPSINPARMSIMMNRR